MKIRMKGPKGEIEFEAEIAFTWLTKGNFGSRDRETDRARLSEVIEAMVALYNGLERDDG